MKILPLALVAVLMLAPAALAETAPEPDQPAQPDQTDRPDQPAQPDQTDRPAQPDQPDDGPTFGDCGGEVCAYDESHGRPLGPEDCIECMGPPTCMDGSATDCDDDLQYIGGPSRGPTDGSCETCRGEEALSGDAKGAAGFGAAAILGIAALAFAVRRRA